MRRMCAAWTESLHFPPPAAIVFSAGQDKDARAMLARLRSLAPDAELYVTRTRNERARTAEDLGAIANAFPGTTLQATSVEDAVSSALSAHTKGRVLLCGSLFAVGEAMAAFGGAPGEQV
jgi:folylpolyglutamate synthase/dihydropteroate synthase